MMPVEVVQGETWGSEVQPDCWNGNRRGLLCRCQSNHVEVSEKREGFKCPAPATPLFTGIGVSWLHNTSFLPPKVWGNLAAWHAWKPAKTPTLPAGRPNHTELRIPYLLRLRIRKSVVARVVN